MLQFDVDRKYHSRVLVQGDLRCPAQPPLAGKYFRRCSCIGVRQINAPHADWREPPAIQLCSTAIQDLQRIHEAAFDRTKVGTDIGFRFLINFSSVVSSATVRLKAVVPLAAAGCCCRERALTNCK